MNMITNYSDPIVTLNQVYREGQTGNMPSLGACIIGPNYNIYSYALAGEDKESLRIVGAEDAFTTSDSAVIKPLPFNKGIDGCLKGNSVKIFVKDANIEVASFNSDSCSFGINPSTTTYAEGLGYNVFYIINKNTSEVIDLTTLGIEVGDTLQITATDSTSKEHTRDVMITKFFSNDDGLYCYALIDASLEKFTLKSIKALKVIDGYIDPNAYSLCQTEAGEGFTNKDFIEANDVIYIKIFKEPTINVTLEGVQTISGGYSVKSGTCYAEYKAESLKWQTKYGQVASTDYVQELLGPICSQNPLAQAVAAALTEADGNFVYFISIPEVALKDETASIEAYKNAIGLTQNKDNLYGIVPCTSSATILQALQEYIQTLEKERIPVLKFLYASAQIEQVYPLEPENQIQGELKLASSTVAGETTVLTFTGSPLFYYEALKYGDIVKIGEYQYEVSNSNGKDSITLKAPVQAIHTQAAKIELIHVVSKNSEIIDKLIASKPVKSSRSAVIFADAPLFRNEYVANYVVAAAIAGRRSASYPHAPLSNIKLAQVVTEDSRGFTKSQLDTLGAHGFWRIGLNSDGQTISRRQLTAAAADDVNKDQQSIICNIDNICMTLKTTGKNLVGNTNISPILLEVLQTTIKAKLAAFEVYVNEYIGPQLLSSNLISIKQDPVYKDRIYAQMEGQPPKPFNRFHMTFYVN